MKLVLIAWVRNDLSSDLQTASSNMLVKHQLDVNH